MRKDRTGTGRQDRWDPIRNWAQARYAHACCCRARHAHHRTHTRARCSALHAHAHRTRAHTTRARTPRTRTHAHAHTHTTPPHYTACYAFSFSHHSIVAVCCVFLWADIAYDLISAVGAVHRIHHSLNSSELDRVLSIVRSVPPAHVVPRTISVTTPDQLMNVIIKPGSLAPLLVTIQQSLNFGMICSLRWLFKNRSGWIFDVNLIIVMVTCSFSILLAENQGFAVGDMAV